MMTDPIADMLTRIRNAIRARHTQVDIPASNVKIELAQDPPRRGLHSGLCQGRGRQTGHPPAAAPARRGWLRRHPRDRAGLESGLSHLRRQGRDPEGAGRSRDQHALDVAGRDDGPRGHRESAWAARFCATSGRSRAEEAEKGPKGAREVEVSMSRIGGKADSDPERGQGEARRVVASRCKARRASSSPTLPSGIKRGTRGRHPQGGARDGGERAASFLGSRAEPRRQRRPRGLRGLQQGAGYRRHRLSGPGRRPSDAVRARLLASGSLSRFRRASRSRWTRTRISSSPARTSSSSGQTAANIRSLRKPDPYKQKGIRYTGELLKKKAGKTGVT